MHTREANFRVMIHYKADQSACPSQVTLEWHHNIIATCGMAWSDDIITWLYFFKQYLQ